MAKYSLRYLTVLNYAPLSFLTYRLQPLLYLGNDSRNEYGHGWLKQFSSAFYPWLDMGQDFTDTGKPYGARATSGFLSDLFQPLFGIGNALKGLLLLSVVAINLPFALFGTMLKSLVTPLFLLADGSFNYFGIYKGDTYLNVMRRDLFKYGIMVSSLIDGINHVIRGVSQVLFSPLTWFAKIPIRSIITGINAYQNVVTKAAASDAPPLKEIQNTSNNSTDPALFEGFNKVLAPASGTCFIAVISDQNNVDGAIESVLKQEKIEVFDKDKFTNKILSSKVPSDKSLYIIKVDQSLSNARQAIASKQNINKEFFDKFSSVDIYRSGAYPAGISISVTVKNGQLVSLDTSQVKLDK